MSHMSDTRPLVMYSFYFILVCILSGVTHLSAYLPENILLFDVYDFEYGSCPKQTGPVNTTQCIQTVLEVI